MKKIILVIALALTTVLSVNSQTNHFNSIIKGKKKQVTVAIDPSDKFIVEIPNKTKEELYEMVMLAVSEKWVNPDEVIDGKLAGSYIKINGGATRYGVKFIGMVQTYFTKVSYNFRFKDGKFMYTVNFNFRIPPSQYSSGGTYPLTLEMTKKNGKKAYTAQYKDIYNSEINKFIELIKSKEVSSNNEDNNNDDW
jgi:hypothetical protein